MMVVVMVLVAGGILWVKARPATPIELLKQHRAEIMRYIASIDAGKISLRDGDNGYYVLKCLADYNGDGPITVKREDGCIVITFAFMPTDHVPELIYSPSGRDSLPTFYKVKQAGITFWKLTQVDRNWFYCEWDN